MNAVNGHERTHGTQEDKEGEGLAVDLIPAALPFVPFAFFRGN
jgi:hypothetical protein